MRWRLQEFSCIVEPAIGASTSGVCHERSGDVGCGTVAGTLIGVTGQASALTLVAGTGWVEDTITTPNAPSVGSPVTFTVGSGQNDIFSDRHLRDR